jgi:hypothetical protein
MGCVTTGVGVGTGVGVAGWLVHPARKIESIRMPSITERIFFILE